MSKKDDKATTKMLAFQFMVPRDDDPVVYESEDLLRQAQKITIKTDKGKVKANEMLVQVKGMLKDAKEKREMIVKPIKEQLLNPVDGFFKRITDPLTKAERLLKVAIGAWIIAEESKARELAEILKDTEKGEGFDITVAPENKIESSNGSRTGVTTVWTFTVDDPDKVPVEHIRAAVKTKRGEEALNQIIRALVDGGTRKIPGVTITESKQISVTLR